MTEKEFFSAQLATLNNNITTSTIILGDFNLDLNREFDGQYGKKSFFDDLTNSLGHHNLDQMVFDNTWSRIINESVCSSRIDHIYTNCTDQIQRLQFSNEAFSDHLLVMFSVIAIEKTQSTKTVFKRSWYGYTKDLVCEELSKVDWSCDRNDPQSFYDLVESNSQVFFIL